MQDTGLQVEYDAYEEKLRDLILALKGDLLDIEMALYQALDSSRSQFFSNVTSFNNDIINQQTELGTQISNEVGQFSQKLREELNRERENFQIKYEQDEQEALADYNVAVIEECGVLELLSDDQNKDAIDELINQFSEKIE